MKKILALALAVVLTPSVLLAAAGPSITATFRVLALGGNIDGVFFFTAGAYKPIKAVANQLPNTIYSYTGAPTMELYKRNPQRDPKVPYVPAGSVAFPAVSGKYLALLIPAAEIAGQGIPDTNAAFGMGQVRVVNAAAMPLAFDFNTQKFSMNAGEFKVLSKPADTNRCELHVFLPTGDTPTEVASNVFGLNTQTKTTLYLVLANGKAVKDNPGTRPAIQIFSTLETATSGSRAASDDANADPAAGTPGGKGGPAVRGGSGG
jgi:hypothetical protein